MVKVDKVIAQIEEAALRAGQYLMEAQQDLDNVNIVEKTANQLVSEIDVKAEEIIVTQLKSIFPEAGFVTEENTVENERKPLHFIVDPLDGTTNYLHHLDLYSVSVAAVYNDSLIAGVVYVPTKNELFSAVKGQGCTLNGEKIQVSNSSILKDSLIATGFPYYNFSKKTEYIQCLDYFMQNTRGLRRMGSAAIDLAYVACGRFCAFYELHLNTWDVAAGILLVEEAGGVVSDFKNQRNDWSGIEIAATNQSIHSEFIAVLRKNFGY